MIHNISTDVVNPPNFDKVVELRGEGSNPHIYDAKLLSIVQTEAYPEIKTKVVTQTQQQAHRQALDAIHTLGWNLINSNPNNGIIEASETSALWGFTDDVVIRVNGQGSKTKIDMRSVSRIGRSDLGQNAKRITRFFEEFDR